MLGSRKIVFLRVIDKPLSSICLSCFLPRQLLFHDRDSEDMSLHNIQIAGDWTSFESIRCYARSNIVKKRAVLKKKGFADPRGTRGEG